MTADLTEVRFSHPHLAALMDAAPLAKIPPAMAIVYARNREAIAPALQAQSLGWINAIFIGPKSTLTPEISAEIEAAGARWVDCPDDEYAAADMAMALGRSGEVQGLMKGSLHSDTLLNALLHKENRRLARNLDGSPARPSHAFVFDIPRYHKPLMVTDTVVSIAPELRDKKLILENALQFARGLEWDCPKVAVVAAVETVNPKIQATLDAAELVSMAREGEFGDCVVDGPFGLDNALSADAARIKGLKSVVAGDPDILLVPDLNAGNMLYKSFIYMGGAECAGLVLGVAWPTIITSRADSAVSRLASIAVARRFMKVPEST